MKKYGIGIVCVFFFLPWCAGYTGWSTRSIIPPGLLSTQQISSSSLNNNVRGSDPTDITTGLFTIQNTGYYFIANDVIANPVYSNNAIIYIDASNVILDLGGKSLALTSTSQNYNIVGIKIAPGRSNVTIFNGAIIGYSSLQINTSPSPRLVKQKSQLMVGIEADSVANVILDNLLISECSSAGIQFSYSNEVQITRVFAQNIGGVVSTASMYGAYLLSCDDAFIAESAFDYVNTVSFDTTNNNVYGLRMQACSNSEVLETSVSNCVALNRGNAYGVSLEACSGCLLKDVRAIGNTCNYNNTGNGSQIAAGIILDATSDSQLEHCTMNSQTTVGLLSLTSTAYGLLVTNSSSGNMITASTSSGNSGGVASIGFCLQNSSLNTIDQCIAQNNKCPVPGSSNMIAYGFAASFGVGNTFSNCISKGNCCYVGAVDTTTLSSFYTLANVPVTQAQIASQVAGGMMLRTETSSNILNSQSTSNLGGQLGTVYGIQLYGNCSYCTVAHNEMLANLGQYQYGYKDFAYHSTTLLRGNMAYGHGNIFTGGAGELVDSGKMNFMFSYALSSDYVSVQNVIKEGDIASINTFEAGSTKWFNFSILGKPIAG